MMQQNAHEKLVGYDVRLVTSRWGPAFTSPGAIAAHLPRPNLKALVSFDRYVMPRLFVAQKKVDAGYVLAPSQVAVPEGREPWFDLFALWERLYELLAVYTPDPSGRDCGLAYAIMVFNGEKDAEPPRDDMFDVLLDAAPEPAAAGEDWPVLGYDIVNLYFQSFLSSFDLSQITTPQQKTSIATLVNDFGLVANLDACADVIRVANAVTPEHGPFFALKTFLLWDRSGMLHPFANSLPAAP